MPPCKDTNCQTCASPDADTCDKCFNGEALPSGVSLANCGATPVPCSCAAGPQGVIVRMPSLIHASRCPNMQPHIETAPAAIHPAAYGLVNGKCVACIDESYSFACDACDGNPEACTRCATTSTGLYSLVGGQCIFTQFPPADFGGPDMLV